MNLILAIVHKEDVDSVTEEVVKGGYRLTQISTSGGFLRRGNSTLLIGVEPEKVNDVLRLIQAGCKARGIPTRLTRACLCTAPPSSCWSLVVSSASETHPAQLGSWRPMPIIPLSPEVLFTTCALQPGCPIMQPIGPIDRTV